MGHDSNDKLFVDIARISGSAEDWDAMDLGSWDEIETGAAAPLTDGAEEKKGDGFLAIT